MTDDKIHLPVNADGDTLSFYYPAKGEGLMPAPVIPQEGARIWLNGVEIGRVGKMEPLESKFTINVRQALPPYEVVE